MREPSWNGGFTLAEKTCVPEEVVLTRTEMLCWLTRVTAMGAAEWHANPLPHYYYDPKGSIIVVVGYA